MRRNTQDSCPGRQLYSEAAQPALLVASKCTSCHVCSAVTATATNAVNFVPNCDHHVSMHRLWHGFMLTDFFLAKVSKAVMFAEQHHAAAEAASRFDLSLAPADASSVVSSLSAIVDAQACEHKRMLHAIFEMPKACMQDCTNEPTWADMHAAVEGVACSCTCTIIFECEMQ